MSTRAERVVAWSLRVAERPEGVVLLIISALLEACLFPAPTEAILVALAIARPRRALLYGVIATAASLAGATIGFNLGAHYFERFAMPLLEWLGLWGSVERIAQAYRTNVVVALVTSGYTPIPYMLYTIAAGAFGVPLATLVGWSMLGRGLKYLPIAAAAYFLGPSVRRVIEKHALTAMIVVSFTFGLYLLFR